MYLWSWVCLMGSSGGSATTMANRDTRQQSVGVAVKHHAPTDASPTSKRPQDQIGSKKINKKLVIVYLGCFKLLEKCFSKGLSVL